MQAVIWRVQAVMSEVQIGMLRMQAIISKMQALILCMQNVLRKMLGNILRFFACSCEMLVELSLIHLACKV
jgi:hypothetical protein